MNRFSALACALLLSTCSVLPEQVPVDFYQLPASTVQQSSSGPRLPGLRIERPLTSEALNANRLLIMNAANQLQAYPGMRLAAPTPLLWRDWLLDAFWRDGRVDTLSAASAGLQAPLELTGMLRSFMVENIGTRPEAVIQFDATLLRAVDRLPLATARFEARQPLSSNTVPDAIAALGMAADRLVRELIQWTVEQGQPQS